MKVQVLESYHSCRLEGLVDSKVVEEVHSPPELPVDTFGEPSVSELCSTL
jgi:hypothetical protein